MIKKRGSALISALFIMTLVAIAATAMSTRLQLDIYRTQLTIGSDKLYLASQVVGFWAMGALADKTNNFNKSDSQGKVLSLPSTFQNIYPEMIIAGEVYDLQNRFNVNNLTDKRYIPFFNKLLATASNLPPQGRSELTAAIYQWITPYTPGYGKDEYLSYYLQQKPPYYPGEQLLQNISEFRLIRGVTAPIYQALSPYITALPEIAPINIYTASKKILASLGDGLSEAQLEELLAARNKKSLRDPKIFNPLLQKLNIQSEMITFESQYFMSVALVKSHDITLISRMVFNRKKDNKGKIHVTLISERLN